MPPKIASRLLPLTTALSCLVCTGLAAPASSGVVSALQKKYVVTEMTADNEQVTKDGTTMAMKSAGIYAVPSTVMFKWDNKVADGKVQKPNAFVSMTLSKSGAHVLQTGDKVYVIKMESKTDGSGDMIKFTLLTVDSLDVSGSDSKKKYDAIVTFKFKKGYLDETPPEEVEQAIESVVAPDTGSDDAKTANDSKAPAPQQQAAARPAPSPVAPPPPAAVVPAKPAPTISIGESSTEVLQAMGMPLQMIDLGKKKTYVYKDMKIIFMNDKVSDMQ